MSILPYMDIKHEYGTFDCVELIKQFYEKELGILIELPKYPKSDEWMTEMSIGYIDEHLLNYFIKIDLQNVKKYDLLVFRNKNKIIHFAIYIPTFRMFHILKGSYAKIDIINDLWLKRLYNVYTLV